MVVWVNGKGERTQESVFCPGSFTSSELWSSLLAEPPWASAEGTEFLVGVCVVRPHPSQADLEFQISLS